MADESFVKDSDDYLLDPELWCDKLPLPFRTVDSVLQCFLDEVWGVIEEREATRRAEESRVKIPVLPDGTLIPGTQDISLVSCGGRDHVIVCGVAGVMVLEQQDGGEWTMVGEQSLEGLTPNALLTSPSSSPLWLALSCKHRVKLFAFFKNRLFHITDITFEQEDEETSIESVLVTSVSVAPRWSHMTVSTNEEAGLLHVYSLPLDSWEAQINQAAPVVEVMEGSSVSVASNKPQEEEIVFNVPTLLYSLHPPSPVTPSLATDPQAVITRLDCSQSCIPSGENHPLTHSYLANRRKAFIEQREDFVEEVSGAVGHPHTHPTCHYLTHSLQAPQLAVWWHLHNQLVVYPIPDAPPKLPPSPSKLLPLTALIVCSAVCPNERHLALALNSGALLSWDMHTITCNVLVRPVKKGDSMTALIFVCGGEQLVVGTEKGQVLLVREQQSTSLAQRLDGRALLDTIDNKVVALHCHPSLSSVVLSVHCTGLVVWWNVTEHEPLCQLTLSNQVPHCATLGSSGFCGLGDDGVLWFDLHSSPILSSHWVTPPTPSHPHRSVADILAHYISSRHDQLSKNKERWNKRWTQLSQTLIKTH